ncbi:acyltransferase [Rhizobium sp. SG741]|uniref:acyltransferase family protein n=1 Tax=Rhizobium sp. SG741 TaxID=2587114 RepID=UPI0014468594|nr:acyltransferase [Rhizobium sp. SG741]NKJ09775.1 peptidoglycan/LPS O-acetylase OafA/YrhL [Rhizobium sp. SG741]
MTETKKRTRDLGLDHIRALAALMVFSWHFLHYANGYPVPFEGAPSIFPLALLDEGHTGVALFMTLSGYLFAKILDGRSVNYLAFLSRRATRLLPLLFAMLVVEGMREYVVGADLVGYLRSLATGLIEPTLPNGAWSLTVEFHFYLLLPLLLFLCRKSPALLFVAIFLAVALRTFLFIRNGTVFWPAYWTLAGRLDQFVFGILAYHYRSMIIRKHVVALVLGTVFCVFYYLFDRMGGFYRMPQYPSPSPIWIILPTIEGAFFSALIAYYDGSFQHSRGLPSRFIAKIGKYSYSIYLWHFYVVFFMADFVQRHIMNISYYYIGQVWALLCFLALVPFAFVSYQIFEKPFMNVGLSYSRKTGPQQPSLVVRPIPYSGD